MNPFVASPQWGWWIIFYFYLGGIAAGAYFLATLLELMGKDEDRHLARLGYRIAFPLIAICGLLLTVDLERPERFWHMLLQSEVAQRALDAGWPLGGWGEIVQTPLLKWFSPMSIGAWALALFGAWSFLSFVASLWPEGRLAGFLGRNPFGYVFHILGSGLGFFVASYTGVLLNATNQPLWSVSEWIAPLFLTSSSSTAIAALLLLGSGMSSQTRERLEMAALWALGLELFLFLVFLASLGGLLPLAMRTWQGQVLVTGTLIVSLLIPLILHLGWRRLSPARVNAAALCALAGGFLLRFGIITIGPALTPALFELAFKRNLESVNAPIHSSWAGITLIALTLVLACAIPVFLRRQWRLSGAGTAFACVVSSLTIASVAYYCVQPLSSGPAWHEVHRFRISPEDDREPGGGRGASLFNYPSDFQMESKFKTSPTP
jgi:formate-dependent nitrite reductase membrane component NrfD